MSFVADKIVMDGLTYDDVLLIPAYSEVLPRTVELSTKFSRNITLNIPFVTAGQAVPCASKNDAGADRPKKNGDMSDVPS